MVWMFGQNKLTMFGAHCPFNPLCQLAESKVEQHLSQYGECDLNWLGSSVGVMAIPLKPQLGSCFLRWPHSNPINIDIIFLIGVDMNNKSATPLGWAFTQELFRAEVNQDRDKLCHEIPVRDMQPSSKLLQLEDPTEPA
jgi:hypothetical protein